MNLMPGSRFKPLFYVSALVVAGGIGVAFNRKEEPPHTQGLLTTQPHVRAEVQYMAVDRAIIPVKGTDGVDGVLEIDCNPDRQNIKISFMQPAQEEVCSASSNKFDNEWFLSKNQMTKNAQACRAKNLPSPPQVRDYLCQNEKIDYNKLEQFIGRYFHTTTSAALPRPY